MLCCSSFHLTMLSMRDHTGTHIHGLAVYGNTAILCKFSQRRRCCCRFMMGLVC